MQLLFHEGCGCHLIYRKGFTMHVYNNASQLQKSTDIMKIVLATLKVAEL